MLSGQLVCFHFFRVRDKLAANLAQASCPYRFFWKLVQNGKRLPFRIKNTPFAVINNGILHPLPPSARNYPILYPKSTNALHNSFTQLSKTIIA